jgi:hypothetical protein
LSLDPSCKTYSDGWVAGPSDLIPGISSKYIIIIIIIIIIKSSLLHEELEIAYWELDIRSE